MRTITPLNKFDNLKNAVFLAGACPRKNYETDWRSDMIAELQKCGFDGDVINPTNPKYDTKDPDYYNKQCTWETEGMHIASTILFWIDRNDEHPAFTTNIEFGIWSGKAPQALVVGIPEGSEKCDYIKWVCKKKNIPCFSTMHEVAEYVKTKYDRPQKIFFTSDTHFGSDRHIELSKRPFMNVYEMDYAFISNWNKTVFANDVVFHLGDFGEIDTMRFLNFGSMFYLKGNYERNDPNFLVTDSRVFVDNTPSHHLMELFIGGDKVCCTHEPISDTLNTDAQFYLFGHIHEKGMCKRNGLNVGVDAHDYTPVSLETVMFYKNAIEKHYDENVFCDNVKLQ